MTTSADIFAECARLAAGAGVGAVASVARRRGSLPMSATAKMLVTGSGSRVGTVGGGCLEAEITERAQAVMSNRVPAVSEHTLNSELAGDYGLTCGGTVSMFIEPVFDDPTLAAVYAECAAVLRRDDVAIVATASDWSGGARKLVSSAGGRVGSDSVALAADVSRFERGREAAHLAGGVMMERVSGAPRLVVFGGGHVGAKVAAAAAFAGWRVTVVDDRPEFSDPSRLSFADRTVTCDYHALPPTLLFDPGTYVVIATRGHQYDALIADQLARLDLRYLGMLGSRRKVALTARLLEGWGVPERDIQAMHAPVGLPIGADTPEEIAISVVAEMIEVRRAGSKRRGGDGGGGVSRESGDAKAAIAPPDRKPRGL